MKIQSHLFVYGSNILAMVFWSFSFIWYKDVYQYLQPFTTVLTRLAISSVLLFIVSASIGKLQKINFQGFKLIFVLALFEPFLYFVGESLGMQLVTPTTGAVIISLIPLLVPVFAFIFLKERLSLKNIIGVLLSFLGVLLVIITRKFELAASSKGILLMGFAVFAAIFYSVLLKRLTDLYNPLTLIAWQNLIGAVLFLPLVLIFDIKDWNMEMISIGAAIPIMKLAIFASSFAFLFYSNAVQVLGAIRANLFTNLIPVFTAAFSFIFLNEKLILQNMLGILLVIIGLILSQINSLNGLKNKLGSHK